MESTVIRLRGVRVHNLRGIDVGFPRNHITVVSGISGSGKSSLVFDTLYAEGRRRYVECLSTYTRQFLDRLDRPDLDAVDGIPPAVAIQRKPPAAQARSTVGTATEIHDGLRLLFAGIGRIHCLSCGRAVEVDTVAAATDRLVNRGGKAVVTFSVSIPAGRGGWRSILARLKSDGFRRIFRDGAALSLDDAATGRSEVEVVADRLRLEPRHRSRIAEAVETAYHFGGDRAVAYLEDGATLRFSRKLHCAQCDRSYRAPKPALFSPNSPLGACPECRGFGRCIKPDMARIIPDPQRTLAEGPVDPWNKPAYRDAYKDLRRAGRRVGLRWDVPYHDLPEEHRRLVEHGGEGFYGIRGFFQWLEGRRYKVHVRVFLSRYRAYLPCPSCGGTGLRPEALAVRVEGRSIADVASFRVEQAREWVEDLDPRGRSAEVAAPILVELRRRLRFLAEVGLGYVTLDRPSRTLSGGEWQRIQLARSLGSGLVDTLYVLDEPTVGLHPEDVDRVMTVIRHLRDLGNTVVMVEHDPGVIAAADHLVDLGPGAGERGGRVVYEGPVRGVLQARGSLTGDYLAGRKRVDTAAKRRAKPGNDGWLVLEGAGIHNLHDVTSRFPLGALTVVTGVSGSGKSSLIRDTLYGALAEAVGRGARVPAGPYRRLRGAEALGGVEMVDQSPVGRSPRSNPVMYVGAFGGIRRRLAATPGARALGLRPRDFSFNVPGGRCERCKGAGHLLVEMHFLPDVLVTCEECGGARYGPRVLAVRFRGRNVAQILDMTVADAARMFADDPATASPLSRLEEAGLGYLRLGQPAPTLSGGEAQRLKLARHLGARSAGPQVFLLDEPTTGLHLHDIAALLRIFRNLVDAGHTLVVVEHQLDLIRAADWVVDLGPGAGPEGGRLVADGTPRDVARSDGPTGRYLARAFSKVVAG